MVTISNKLGDCKDVSTLFHTLAKKEGLKTNLVLVLTADNGEEALMLPNSDFNHCIVKIDFENQTLFQELTDAKLPFGVTPNSIKNAQGLVIPNKIGDSANSQLISIPGNDNFKNVYYRNTDIVVEGKDLGVKSNLIITGASSSSYRHHFTGLTKDEEKENVIGLHDGPFQKTLKIKDYSMNDLETFDAKYVHDVEFDVENDAPKIGGMTAMKLPLFATIASPKDFVEEKREHPYLFYNYEPYDEYETTLNVKLAGGKKFVEIPENFNISNSQIDYEITFNKVSETELIVKRKAKITRGTISSEAYGS